MLNFNNCQSDSRMRIKINNVLRVYSPMDRMVNNDNEKEIGCQVTIPRKTLLLNKRIYNTSTKKKFY